MIAYSWDDATNSTSSGSTLIVYAHGYACNCERCARAFERARPHWKPWWDGEETDDERKARLRQEHRAECQQHFARPPRSLGRGRRQVERFRKRGWRW